MIRFTAREQKREERKSEATANKNHKSGDNAGTSNSNNNQNNQSSSSATSPREQALINMLFSGPSLNQSGQSPGTLGTHGANNQGSSNSNNNNSSHHPRYSGSSVHFPEDDNNTGTLAVVNSAEMGNNTTNTEQYREYVYSHHSVNEARALYQRMLYSRNYTYQSSRLKESLASTANTLTSDEAFAPAQSDEIKCPTCPTGWEDLINFEPPKSVRDKLAAENKVLLDESIQMGGYPTGSWYVQNIKDATGSQINLDRYSLKITTLPVVGHRLTAKELFDYIRINLNDFMSEDVTEFDDYPDPDFAESTKWPTDNYLGVVKVFTAYLPGSFGLFYDDLGVIATDKTASSWTFSTLHTPETHDHAVSGNRQFGFTANSDGTYTIFARGADRLTAPMDASINWATGESVFDGAEDLWNSFMDNIVQFIDTHQGDAQVETPVSNRYDITE